LAEIGVETKFGQKTACPDMATFSPPKFRQNITDLEIWKGFWGDLEHSNILLFEQIDKLRQSPSTRYVLNLLLVAQILQ